MDNQEIAKTMENILKLFNEALESRNAIQRVRELHKNEKGLCIACEDTYESSGLKDYPCPTIKALDGEQ